MVARKRAMDRTRMNKDNREKDTKKENIDKTKMFSSFCHRRCQSSQKWSSIVSIMLILLSLSLMLESVQSFPNHQQHQQHQRQLSSQQLVGGQRQHILSTYLHLSKKNFIEKSYKQSFDDDDAENDDARDNDSDFVSRLRLGEYQPMSTLSRRSALVTSVGGIALTGISLVTMTTPESANAASGGGMGNFFSRRKGVYVVDTREDISEEVPSEQVDTPVPTLSSEYALLKVLPVKNPVFRTLEQNLEEVSALRFEDIEEKSLNSTWNRAQKSIQTAIAILKNKRGQLEPVFNPEDSTELAILKGERGAILIEDLLEEFIELSNATMTYNKTLTFEKQKDALLALSSLGELLVKEFPYRVPTQGKFSYLPRLSGRCKVTFRIKRKTGKGVGGVVTGGEILGNITIVADGYTAPITAGNFVDLCIRNFYTGLPVKTVNKKFGSFTDQVTASVNVLGSFNEGFYDPLTAKLRRIPLEIIRFSSGQPKLSYKAVGFPDTSISDISGEASLLGPSINFGGKPLLTFDTPGLVALNHPDKNPNGASSEFFGVTSETLENRSLLDGSYAPFGYIIGGYDIFCRLQADDIIDATFVDPFGQLNLIKIRESNFKEAAQGAEAESV